MQQQQTQAEAPQASETARGGSSFRQKLEMMREMVGPELIKQRDGFRDRNGNVNKLDYIEWNAVADLLDDIAVDWSSEIKDVRVIGEIVAVTVAIKIDGVVREGIGTGKGETELGIKKAESDALKRAAVKFGIGRQLYSDDSEHDSAVDPRQQPYQPQPVSRPQQPQAPIPQQQNAFRPMQTPQQQPAAGGSGKPTEKMGKAMYAIARGMDLRPDDLAMEMFQVKEKELTFEQASQIIETYGGRN